MQWKAHLETLVNIFKLWSDNTILQTTADFN